MMRQPSDPLPTVANTTSTPATPLPAASLIIVRPPLPNQAAHSGFEVLLMERAAASTNFAGALVFPGGKVDLQDAQIAMQADFPALWERSLKSRLSGQDAASVAALYGAALRETLEEVGLLWSAEGHSYANADAATLRQALLAGEPWHACAAHAKLHLSVANIQPFSRWITPTSPNLSVKRFDTWFFLAALPAGEKAQADGEEAQSLVWATPQALLKRYEEGAITLAPPQIMTLAHLARFPDIATLQRHSSEQTPYTVAPVSIDQNGSRIVCFPGDAMHAERTAAMPGPTRLVMHGKRFLPPEKFTDLFA